MRHDGRQADELRPLKIKRRYTRTAPGSVLISAGRTTVLCCAAVEPEVPGWLKGQGRGWLTAEYSMLPGSTNPRKRRERGGESRRADDRDPAADRPQPPGRDRLAGHRRADDNHRLRRAGSRRRHAHAEHHGRFFGPGRGLAGGGQGPARRRSRPLRDSVAAVSVGMVGGQPLLDLCYEEDFAAEVDMNVVMTGSGRFVEVQGTGEEATFSEQELSAMFALARSGIADLTALQRKALGRAWCW